MENFLKTSTVIYVSLSVTTYSIKSEWLIVHRLPKRTSFENFSSMLISKASTERFFLKLEVLESVMINVMKQNV